MSKNTGIVSFSLFVSVILPVLVIFLVFKLSDPGTEPLKIEPKIQTDAKEIVDHSQFEILQQEFTDPRDVTEACIGCHNGRDDEIMSTAHWTWSREAELPNDRGTEVIGKANLINNFCTGATGNNGSCMKCHIGYGWEDKTFDFTDSRNVDCLVCHDNTRTYVKRSGGAGMPATAENATLAQPVPDYNYVAQNVGLPTNENCGACHFNGGGGNNVKHGDLEEALLGCSVDLDVHMSPDGANLVCTDCHKTENHNITGKLYAVSAMNRDRVFCSDCHTDKPHNDRIIDSHNEKIACQTCHIPTYAKANATKLWWDWSTAGRLKEDGHTITELDADGNHNYLSIKGNFVWDSDVTPEYQWHNGTADHFLTSDTIAEIPVKINELFGSYTDSTAKIVPVKVHRGKQMYDTEYNTLVNMKLYADNKGEGAFWKDFDWDTSAYLGMKYNERPYSGQWDFVETEVSWPVNHMVAPKEQALSCAACHNRDSQLAAIDDIYIPGRDRSRILDNVGLVVLCLTLVGIIIHASLRVYFYMRPKTMHHDQ